LVSPLIVHPTLAAAAVLFIITAYLLKTRRRQYFSAHYTAGILAFSMFVTAFPIGIYEVAESGGLSVFPTVLIFHFANFFVAASLIITQSALGASMLLFGRKRWLYAFHRRLSKYVLAVVLIQGALGLAVLIGILPYVFQ
jgi:hypothetical protein